MKRLVLCFDGTWNSPDMEENGVASTTNVFKISNAIAEFGSDGIRQDVYYHTGVGTDGKIDSFLGGALGAGISRHIYSGYHWLSLNYELGDEIFMYGFSRGAFTVRSLGGLIGKGLPDIKNLSSEKQWDIVHHVYDNYRKGKNIKDFENFIKVTIRLIGVWDTVGALGIPDDFEFLNLFDKKKNWQFHDRDLGEHVIAGRHAIAVDEIRSSFTVTHWSNADTHPGIVEKWFPGAHSDVGGGNAVCDLSDCALEWMIDESKRFGLEFREGYERSLRPDPCGVLHNSYTGFFSKLRSRPRCIPAMIESNGDYFHDSAFERQIVSPISYPKYHPTKVLEPRQSVTFDVFANQRWNYSGLYMEKGNYKFSSSGEWKDSRDKCDWRGTDIDEFTFGDMVRNASSAFLGTFEKLYRRITQNKSTDFLLTKRVEHMPWFCMVGAIANGGLDNNDEMASDGSPDPHQYVQLPEHENEPLKVTKPGYLYCFPNDAWTLYGNNKGSVKLTVERTD